MKRKAADVLEELDEEESDLDEEDDEPGKDLDETLLQLDEGEGTPELLFLVDDALYLICAAHNLQLVLKDGATSDEAFDAVIQKCIDLVRMGNGICNV